MSNYYGDDNLERMEYVFAPRSRNELYGTGVYYLYKGQFNIVYVGSSTNGVVGRLSSHQDKDFDSYFWFDAESKEQSLQMEAISILTKAPIYNKSVPGNSRYLTHSGIQKKLLNHMTKDEVYKYLYRLHSNGHIKRYEFMSGRGTKIHYYDVKDLKVKVGV